MASKKKGGKRASKKGGGTTEAEYPKISEKLTQSDWVESTHSSTPRPRRRYSPS